MLRGRRRVLALVVVAAAVAAPAAWFAGAQPEAVRTVSAGGHEVQVVSLAVGDRTRHYRLFVPPARTSGPRPLLVALHPLNGSAARFEQTSGLDRGAATDGVVVAYPDGLGRSWDAGTCCGYAVRHRVDDVGFVARVVADVARRVSIDPARVAVTGFSNGALMSYRLACERPDLFRAAVAVAGDMIAPRCAPARPVALLHVHGTRDPLIPLAGVASSRLDPAGFPPASTSVERVAAADRCSGATTSTEPSTVTWTAVGCAAGTPVRLVTVAGLGHHYPTGAADATRFGVDMSTLTWSFLSAAWATV
jgi:polyhydroxybutyrate depolymerase